jgi:hypothetical protein
MPLRNLIYISDSAISNNRVIEIPKNNGWLKPLWVLPRAWCVMTSLQAKGVPRHKTAAFIQLQLTRLAPFIDSGVYACRTGDWVHLWFWENQRVKNFCQTRNLDFSSLQVVPESVCMPKIRTGAVLHECINGVEAQLWFEGTLLDSVWWPDKIDVDKWQAWVSTVEGTGRLLPIKWPEIMPHINHIASNTPKLQNPWATNILGKKWRHNLPRFNIGLLYSFSGSVFVGLSGYLVTQLYFLHEQQDHIDQEITTLSTQVVPIISARSKALEQLQWLNKVVKLNQKVGINDILLTLTPLLLQQEVALREFEYDDGELRLILVPINNELNIAEIIQKLEALPKFKNIRLLPESDMRILRLSIKVNLIDSNKTKNTSAISTQILSKTVTKKKDTNQ